MNPTVTAVDDAGWQPADFLTRIVRNEVDDFSHGPSAYVPQPEADGSAAEIGFETSTLSLIAGTPVVHEELRVRRSDAFTERALMLFVVRAGSRWALDAWIDRLTDGALDWTAFRSALLQDDVAVAAELSRYGNMSLGSLFRLSEALHERDSDPQAELALLRYIAGRVSAGDELDERYLPLLCELLLDAGYHEPVRDLAPRIEQASWMRHAIETELRHPRFGGDLQAMLRLFNEPFRRLGLEEIELVDPAPQEGPFFGLRALPRARVDEGPMVTVIMTCWEPDEATLSTAVRSIIAQTYQNWELILTDDASPTDPGPLLAKIAALDPRIRVIRNDVNAGTYVRRNEAIQVSHGDLITMQDSDDWSHPRRLETQVRDLLAHPDRLANMVWSARVTEDLSLVTRRGLRMHLSEPSLMFWKEQVLSEIGYFDSVPKAADREFRLRLEAATGTRVALLVPAVPLVLMLADSGSLSGGEFGRGYWQHPNRLVYWSAYRHFHKRIAMGLEKPQLAFPLRERKFDIPSAWEGEREPVKEYDLVAVLDAREDDRTEFLAEISNELADAVDAGLRVAVVQSDALTGPTGRQRYYPPALQSLLDTGRLDRIQTFDEARARAVVVRHAGAAQGHGAEQWGLRADRLYIVEDPAAGDVRGATFAVADVERTVSAWFGLTPVWLRAKRIAPVAHVAVVTASGADIRIVIELSSPVVVPTVRLEGPSGSAELAVRRPDPLTVVGVCRKSVLAGGSWNVMVEAGTSEGHRTRLRGVIDAATFMLGDESDVVVRARDNSFRLVTVAPSAQNDGDRLGLSEGPARVSRVSVGEDNVTIELEGGSAERLLNVSAIRMVGDTTVRHRALQRRIAADGVAWERRLARFAGMQWTLVGRFSTPDGAVDIPLRIAPDVVLEGNERFQPKLHRQQLVIADPHARSTVARIRARLARLRATTPLDAGA